MVNAVILRPLGYPQPDRLVYISSQFPKMGFDQFWISPPEFLEFQERTRSFSAVGAFATGQANLTAADRPLRVNTGIASAGLFKVLGVNPMLGRAFDVSETLPNGPQVAMLSYETWQSAFGGMASLVGSQAEINGIRRTIIGIMPPHFDVADNHVELWTPLVFTPEDLRDRGNHYIQVLGLLKPGVTIAHADADIRAITQRLQQQYPETNSGRGAYVISMLAHYTRGSRPYLPILVGAVAVRGRRTRIA